MAAANNIADTEKTVYLIRHLPLELREKIYKEFIAKTVKERNKNGFESIHFSIKNAPYCSKKERITDIIMCKNCFENELLLVNERCEDCHLKDQNYLCYLCDEEGTVHHIHTDVYPERDFIVFYDHQEVSHLMLQRHLPYIMLSAFSSIIGLNSKYPALMQQRHKDLPFLREK